MHFPQEAFFWVGASQTLFILYCRAQSIPINRRAVKVFFIYLCSLRHVRVHSKRACTVWKNFRRHGIASMHCTQACQGACKARMHRLPACQDALYSEHAKRACTVCKHVRRHDVSNMHCAQACQVICKARMQSLQACQEEWYSEHAVRTGMSGCMQSAHAKFTSMSGGMEYWACTTHRYVRVHVFARMHCLHLVKWTCAGVEGLLFFKVYYRAKTAFSF